MRYLNLPMSPLKKKYHLNVDVPKKGSTFAKCIICESLKDLISKVGKNNASAKEHELKMKRHNKHQESCRHLYDSWKSKSIQSKEQFLCIIHGKMDHLKIVLQRLQVKNKKVVGLSELPIMLTRMIVHGHGDEAILFNTQMNCSPMTLISQLDLFCIYYELWKSNLFL